MKEKIHIQNLIKEALRNLNVNEEIDFAVEHPDDFKNGDYSTNVAMVYAKELKMNPKDLAEKIVKILRQAQDESLEIQEIRVAGPGFINFYLSREFFLNSIKEILEQNENWGKNNLLNGKKIMVEYTQPNPFKPFHIGHLMSNAIGESISRLLEYCRAEVIRANYQGDVGPHVAKAIYILIKNKNTTNSLTADFVVGDENFESSKISEIANYIGRAYSEGSNLYDTDENIKKEIDEINKKIYNKSDEEINEIYNWGRKITLNAFEEIYKLLGTEFNEGFYFFESEMAPVGENVVKNNIGKIFKESSNAIIFNAEDYDPKLHTRVFINSQGLPTYETKEIGLTLTKFEKVKDLDLSIVTTAIEQGEYMKVVQKAISLIYPDLEKKMKHITHGMMRFADGKMSSRKGNVITGESLINEVQDKVFSKMMDSNSKHKKVSLENSDLEEKTEEIKNICKKVGVSALKYSILKSSLGSDIIYDFEKSISFEGDSGPYLQYSAVRAKSILEKSKSFNKEDKKAKSSKAGSLDASLEAFREVTNLEKKLYQFPEVVEYSYQKLEPHHIATYLTELASEFNTFYANTQILPKEDPEGKNTSYGAGSKYIEYHLGLTEAFYITMKNGLNLLGIEIPERM